MGRTVGIIGGGAAGMMAAVTAARQGAEVTLMEGNDRLGKKILSTGNGKCNLGNEKLDVWEYYTESPEFLERCLEKFGTEDTKAFFRDIGLMVKSRNGYLYPVCEQAAAVLDVLRFEVRELGVRVVTDCKIAQIEVEGGSSSAKTQKKPESAGGDTVAGSPGADAAASGKPGSGILPARQGKSRRKHGIRVRGNGQDFWFDRVILACGGCAAPKTGSDGSGYELARQLGHGLVPVVPALVQLRCREDYFKAVAGVRADAELSVLCRGECVARERGELQLTDYGISGIPVFQLSRVVNRLLTQERKKRGEVEVIIDFLPDETEEAFERLCAGRQCLGGKRTVEEFFTGVLHKKLMLLFIKLAGLKPGQEIGSAEAEKVRCVWRLCREWRVHVTGSNSYDNAQVCAGGVPLDEVSENLESKLAEGVYFAGEILDVDGRCGGYNLQWAWCSGYLAGRAAGKAGSAGRNCALMPGQ